jgi:hypothetical protein
MNFKLKHTSTTAESVKVGKLELHQAFGWNTGSCASLVTVETGGYRIDYTAKFQM